MKLFTSSTSQRGNVLLVTLGTMVIMGITLASYMGLVRAQNRSTMRSQQWNSAIPVAEAGVEEALAHLYENGTNASLAGWVSANGSFTKERYLGSNKFMVSITLTSNPPAIVSEGYVQVPLQTEWITPPRTIRVLVTNDALFAKGMVAKGVIDLSGNNIETDSFDSTDSNHSNNGRYEKVKNRDNGDIATNSGLINSLNVGNANINGRASTGPGGSISIGANGTVGSKNWNAQGKNGIEPGWSSDDMNVNFPDVKVPFTGGGLTPLPGVVGLTSYNYTTTGGNYQMSSLSMSGSEKMLITGDTVLYVTGNISISGNAQIVIATGASLKLYVGGANASIGGNGVANQTTTALSFLYYGLPTNTSVSMSGNAAFTGAIYAPQAAMTLGGGGNSDYDFVGASVTASAKLNGHFKFHYDEALGKLGPRRGFTVLSWNEI